MTDIATKLINKSTEAFMMAIEIYNKPSIKYRVEGFSFFICNAWELMLKAHMINVFGNESIYYKDNPGRTLNLENCIKKVFTNDKDPLRLNLEKIIELRNTSTHYITQDYEMVYIPLFQSCVLNFTEKIKVFHDIDITQLIPLNFLTLTVSMKALIESEIVAKYPEEIAAKILTRKREIDNISLNSNEKFSIRIDHYHFITKDKDKATSFVHIDKSAEPGVRILRELKDPNNTHKFQASSCLDSICRRIQKENIVLLFKGKEAKFNMSHFTNFCKYYGIKENEKLCYIHKQFTTPRYSYSQQAIDFIYEEIKKDQKTS